MRKYPQFKKNLLKAMNWRSERVARSEWVNYYQVPLEDALEKIMPKGMSDRKRELWKVQAKRIFRSGF